ncbi:unnamed protein product [Discosporangium mesarthrocarpum]
MSRAFVCAVLTVYTAGVLGSRALAGGSHGNSLGVDRPVPGHRQCRSAWVTKRGSRYGAYAVAGECVSSSGLSGREVGSRLTDALPLRRTTHALWVRYVKEGRSRVQGTTMLSLHSCRLVVYLCGSLASCLLVSQVETRA